MTTVRIIFCGGCNSSYDRIQTANQLRNSLPPDYRFIETRNTEVDLELIIQGCRTACRQPLLHSARRTLSLTSQEDARKLICELQERN